MTPKEQALGIAQAMADVESAIETGNQVEAADAAKALHKRMRAGLYRNAGALGLSDDDVIEIDNLGPQRRGGEPKENVEADNGED